MTITNKREFFQLAATATGAMTLLAAVPGDAFAYQGNMERALAQLQGALRSLHQATSDKGGHKANAAALIQQAMSEVQAGIDFAAQRFGD